MPLRYMKLKDVPISEIQVSWILEVAGRPFEISRVEDCGDATRLLTLYPVFLLDGEDDALDWNERTPYYVRGPIGTLARTVYAPRVATQSATATEE